MSQDARLAVLEEQFKSLRVDVTEISGDVKYIRLYVAQSRGVNAAIRHSITVLMSAIGLIVGYFGAKHD